MNVSDPASGSCKNCSADLVPGGSFCHSCGQKVALPRLTLQEIGRDILHALVHVDRSALSLIRMLILRPGIVARNYVDGLRKRYFSPFAFLVVVVALASAAIELLNLKMVLLLPDTPNAAADLLNRFLGRHANLVLFVQVPLLAAVCRGLWHRDKFNYAEYLVLASYTSGMHVLFYVVALVPAWYAFATDAATQRHLYYAYLPIWPVYFGFAASQFLGQRRVLSAVKGIFAVVLTQAISEVAISLIVTLYLGLRGTRG